MINNLIANIKAQLGTESNMDEFVAEKYAGSEVAEELLALDDMDNIEASMESATEAIIGFGLMEQEAALEAQGLQLTEFNRYEGSLGNESLVNMAKRGGYDIIIAIKKAVSKIWKFFMSIIDFFIICDGRWKSYSKLAKKYREKMNRLKAHMGEKEADKEYSIRKVGDAAKFVNAVITGMAKFTRTAPTATTKAEDLAKSVIKNIVDAMAATYVAVSSALGGTVDADGYKKSLGVNDDGSLIDGGVNEGASERLKAVKESMSDYAKDIREADAVPVETAKSSVLSALSTIETATKKDIKWFKQWKKMSKDIDKAIDKLGKDTAGAGSSDLLTALGRLSQGLVEFKRAINVVMKETGSFIQLVLADAAKVIAGETRIGD